MELLTPISWNSVNLGFIKALRFRDRSSHMEELKAFRKHLENTYPFSEEDWLKVQEALEPVHLKKHQFLIQQQHPVDYDYWVYSGCLKACFTDSEGKELILQFATEHWWISDYNALFNRQSARIDVDCLEPCVLLRISLEDRYRLYEEVPAFESFFIRKITNGYVALQNRILSILTKNPRERYEEFLHLYPELSRRIPKKYIAQYLGVSRETLSRLYLDK